VLPEEIVLTGMMISKLLVPSAFGSNVSNIVEFAIPGGKAEM
jgi:hypothetical protein